MEQLMAAMKGVWSPTAFTNPGGWFNPTCAYVDGVCQAYKTEFGFGLDNFVTYYGFENANNERDIPWNAQITGVEVLVDCFTECSWGGADGLHLAVSDDGGSTWSANQTIDIPSTEATRTAGHPGFLWGRKLTPAIINDGTSFRVKIDTKSCHLAGSNILLATGHYEPVENLQVGDMVAGIAGAAEITNIIVGSTREWYEINQQLKVTAGHPIFTARGSDPVPIEKIQYEDKLVNDVGGYTDINHFVRYFGAVSPIPTYCLTVEGGIYVSDGFQVHNKPSKACGFGESYKWIVDWVRCNFHYVLPKTGIAMANSHNPLGNLIRSKG